jgi:hypothetical protein
MPELTYGKIVHYEDISGMEGYYENSEDKQNRDSDRKQGVSDNKESD